MSSRARAAVRRPAPLRAELARLRRRRLCTWATILSFVLLLVALAGLFFTHSQDLAAARAEAETTAQGQIKVQERIQRNCEAAASTDTARADCQNDFPTRSMTAADFFSDPRFFAAQGIPTVGKAVAFGTALLAMVLGATAIGADWSSRTLLTLITWEPRRSRFLLTRFTAIGLWVTGICLAFQGTALAGAVALTHWRGSWRTRPEAGPSTSVLRDPNFWRDAALLAGRAVLFVVAVALFSAAVTVLVRHSAGILGLAFAWFVLAENALRTALASYGIDRWLLSTNILAWLEPEGLRLQNFEEFSPQEIPPGQLLTHLDGLLVLGPLLAAILALAVLTFRRRDL